MHHLVFSRVSAGVTLACYFTSMKNALKPQTIMMMMMIVVMAVPFSEIWHTPTPFI